MVEIKDVSFSYSGATEIEGGIQGINLNIEKGQIVVLCGESGCGKTTLTRLINGLIPHYYEGNMVGTVYLDGKNIY